LADLDWISLYINILKWMVLIGAPTVISATISVLIELVMILKSMVTTTLMTQNPSNRLTKHL